jgi:adenosine deaminase
MTRALSCLRVPVVVLACSAAVWFTGCDRSGRKQAESRAEEAYNVARGNPLALRAFLVEMPKGGDLHYHLGGGVYAESWIRAGAEDHLCVNIAARSFVKKQGANCASDDVPAENALHDQQLFDKLVDAFSMRAFVPTPSVNGHDQFFNTFGRFGAVDSRHTGEWLDEAATRAASQNEQYLELMETPPFDHAAKIAKEIGWQGENFALMRDQLLAKGLRDEIPATRAYLDEEEAGRRQREHCGEAGEAPACRVQVRYIYQVLRAFSPEQVFAQTLLGFEAAAVDPRIVGINYVQPEDDRTAMEHYALQMRQIAYLHSVYPKLHISLHAGELAPEMVPPDGLRFHIRMAVEVAHAERIGHGVDVMYEDRPYDLLKEMAANHVMVEINLTSNNVILGIAGYEHPFRMYRKYEVPVALSTDDEGVSRIDLTHEYELAVETFALSYPDLKQMVRTSIEHSFLPGASLWQERDKFTRTVADCATDVPGADKPSAVCTAFLGASERAQQQWELERRFTVFESGPLSPPVPPRN